jgi:two-component system cell cycle response regulator DivK
MRILYVEDNEVNRALVERVMRARQCSVVFQDEGEGALEALANDSTIDLILLDIELAGTMTGLDVIQTMRARNDQRPVVAVTAYAMMGDRERILEAGCDQYLPKPLVVTDLLNVIDHYQEQLAAKASPKPVEATAPTPATPAAPAAPTAESPVPPPAEPVPASEPTPPPAQAAPSPPADAKPVESPTRAADAKPVESPTPPAPTPTAAVGTLAASASPTPGTAERPALAITPAPVTAPAPTPSSDGAQPVDQQEKVAVEDKESS